MTLEQQMKFFTFFTTRMKEIMLKKGDDYSNTTDRLSNFKTAGPNAGITPEQNCLSLMSTKVARLGELIKGKNPKNESILDSLLDLANYTVLLAMLIDDSTTILIDVNAIPPLSDSPYKMFDNGGVYVQRDIPANT